MEMCNSICFYFFDSRLYKNDSCFFLLRKYAFQEVFYKKLNDEMFLVKNFIKQSVRRDINNNNELKLFKEKIINSI